MRTTGAAVAAFVLVVAVCIGGWFLYWHLAAAGQANRYEVNRTGQQYQAGLIAQERDRAQAFDVATDPGQKKQIANQFCAVYLDLNPAPADLSSAAVHIGC